MNQRLFENPRWPVFFVGFFIVLGIVCGIAWLYLPFSGSPLVFDDQNMLPLIHDVAQTPFSSDSRTFPYFSIGLVHVLGDGDLAWNRGFNLVLHGLSIVALYFFLRRALSGLSVPKNRPENTRSHRLIVVAACLWLAFNPVAVYSIGYLVQRTIVFATLFAILSLNLYLRAQQRERRADLFSAALLAGCSMMSKEHAVLLPLATVALTPLVTEWNRASVTRALTYLSLSLPFSLWVSLHRGGDLIGNMYEPYAGDVVAQFMAPEWMLTPLGLWVMSGATQLLLFWKYLLLWLIPNPQWMSADLRIDFSTWWTSVFFYLGVLLSVGLLTWAAVHWLKSRKPGRHAGLFASALLYAVILFAVELSVVRVQEPFVLYRSFLWMPAYALLLCGALARADAWLERQGGWPRPAFWGVLLVGGLALFPLAQDRLRSFSSEEALWQDALNKLPYPDVPGADRIYYNLAGEAFKRKDFQKSLAYSEQVIQQNPRAFQGYLGKGTGLLALGDLEGAMRFFDEAEAHTPPKEFLGYIEFKRCNVHGARGDSDETIACLKRSAKLGYENARFRLKMAGIAED